MIVQKRPVSTGQKAWHETNLAPRKSWQAAPQGEPRPEGRASLKIIPLGGCEEVGRNMTVFEYGNDIVILDMGLQFPEEDMPGIDYVIPNVEYLRGKEKSQNQ